MNCRWSVAAPQPESCRALADALHISPLLAQCLLNRDLREPELLSRFLTPRLKNLADPFLIPNMAAAVERLLAARQRQERLVIFGDYDVDGVSSTALLVQSLGALGWQVASFLPQRLEEGYGLSQDGIDRCLQEHPTRLLLAVDCGSNACNVITRLGRDGIDTIVLDHHQISSPPPPAVALVNPQLGGAFHELCSVGLAFKLVHALVKQMRASGLPAAEAIDLRGQLDLVALGTIADVVPLLGENRILVAAGLDRLNATSRPGLLALKSVAASPAFLGAYEVAFQLAPRLNAAGRLEDAQAALNILLTNEAAQAQSLARSLDEQNRRRRDIERGMAAEITAALRERFDPARDFVIVEGRAEWHAGVAGIVASRVLQQFYRPTILFGGGGEVWRGSGRSIEGFDLAASLLPCADLLVRHGGHAMAAGMTIHPDKVPLLRQRLNDAARLSLRPEQLQPTLKLDAEAALSELTLEQVDELSRLDPTGQGNPGVRLALRGLSHRHPPQRMGRENQHVKLRLTDGRGVMEAVWWNCSGAELPQNTFDIACAPSINVFRGARTVQLKLLDWQPSGAAIPGPPRR
jgi:single-stranded-DNA-specific exonuclease